MHVTLAVLTAVGVKLGEQLVTLKRRLLLKWCSHGLHMAGARVVYLLCLVSSDPGAHVGMWIYSGVIWLLFLSLCCMHISQARTQFVLYDASEGK